MTERYSFAVDNTVVWNQDAIDPVDASLSETINEGYVTAEDDSSRYLSVLENTNEISLDNLNITLTNPKLEAEDYAINETVDQNEELNDQVVVFSVDGSDELFGIQMVQDEEGNLQKYQFQFRQNEDGQLEAIPETITLVKNDDEEGANGVPIQQNQQEMEYQEPHDTRSLQVFVQEDHSQEHILPDHFVEEQTEEEEGVIYEQRDEVDVKPGIVQLQNIKQEFQEAHAKYQDVFSEEQPEDIEEYHTFVQNNQTEEETRQILQADSEDGSNSIQNQEFEHVEVNPDLETVQETMQHIPEEINNQNNDSDEGDYEIVEGLHITGDVEEEIFDRNSHTNILKQALKVNKGAQSPKLVKKDNKLYLYVVQHPEKENVETLSMEMSNLSTRPNKINPRSILKSSYQARNEIETDQQEERFNKRFAKCKEAVEAIMFHNFISKTTIPQAPVRKDRLPRKQQIKPVERMDEEIVVQEMMVSSNGFVETVKSGNKENLSVTDYVELSDSDDDYDPKRTYRKAIKKRHRRRKVERIEISDDEDEDETDEDSDEESRTSVIELDDSEEEEYRTNASSNQDKEDGDSPPKRRRGRPPKNRASCESPAKKTKTDTIEENPKKPEIPCPKCDKTFPSQNSLKTHLQHHNLQSSMKRALPEYKYKCDKCGTTFINLILLNKHMCSKLFNCPICKKKFPDLSSLNGHKRTHVKEKMVKTTEVVKVSPKMKQVQPTSAFKVPKIASLKCRICGKLCSSLQNLTVHIKSHKFTCNTCSNSFPSKLILEKHLREKCVKSPRKSPVKKTPSKLFHVKCDVCRSEFNSHRALFKHKVTVHKLETPDNTVLEGSEGDEEKATPGGIPAGGKLKGLFSEFSCELDFND